MAGQSKFYKPIAPFWGSTYDLSAAGAGGFNTLPAGLSPWSIMQIGGANLPGIFKLKRCKKGHVVDKKKRTGTASETLTSLGPSSADIHGVLTMWLPIQWDAWRSLTHRILLPLPNKGPPQYFTCYHPALDAEGITQIYHIWHTPVMVQPDETGEVEIFWNEWLPDSSKSATSTPTIQGDIAGDVYKQPTAFDVQSNPSDTEGKSPAQTASFQPAGTSPPANGVIAYGGG